MNYHLEQFIMALIFVKELFLNTWVWSLQETMVSVEKDASHTISCIDTILKYNYKIPRAYIEVSMCYSWYALLDLLFKRPKKCRKCSYTLLPRYHTLTQRNSCVKSLFRKYFVKFTLRLRYPKQLYVVSGSNDNRFRFGMRLRGKKSAWWDIQIRRHPSFSRAMGLMFCLAPMTSLFISGTRLRRRKSTYWRGIRVS